ncbi:DUF4238 domain-containing protein [Candidatus Pacearchaeota archaeon]|nr:DUF4238 domain-containing protein [Candidatus Pacearchaeota archaeon]
MPENKKQHFVPRFYLRNFASDKAQKQINLYSFSSSRLIRQIGLNDQCYKDYFYGKDKRNEKNLSKIEGISRNIITKILNREKMPDGTSLDYIYFLMFILLQIARTTSAESDATKAMEELLKQLLINKNPQHKQELEKIKLNATNMPSLNLGTAIQSLFLLTDLNYKILENSLNEGFITSDNPAIRYNFLFETLNKHFTHTGFAVKGLMIFLPLSSKYTIIFYDKTSYTVGESGTEYILIDDQTSLDSINALQIATCVNNIYFDDSITDDYMKSLNEKYKKNRTEKEFKLKNKDDLYWLDETTSPFHLNVKCLNVLETPTQQVKLTDIRNPELAKFNEKFFKLIYPIRNLCGIRSLIYIWKFMSYTKLTKP